MVTNNDGACTIFVNALIKDSFLSADYSKERVRGQCGRDWGWRGFDGKCVVKMYRLLTFSAQYSSMEPEAEMPMPQKQLYLLAVVPLDPGGNVEGPLRVAKAQVSMIQDQSTLLLHYYIATGAQAQ